MTSASVENGKLAEIADCVRRIVQSYFLRRGEEFAASLTRSIDRSIDEADLKSIIIECAPAERLSKTRENVTFLLNIVINLLTSPSEATKEYLSLISDTYTLFAFLEEVPDVQKVTKKLFTHLSVWLDTSVLLPVIAEQAAPEELRPFTTMFRHATAAGTELFVIPGILEEIVGHLNRCLAYSRSQKWEGRVHYVYARYALSGKAHDQFADGRKGSAATISPNRISQNTLRKSYAYQCIIQLTME